MSFGGLVNLGSNFSSTTSEAMVLSCLCSPDVYKFPALFNHLDLEFSNYSNFLLACATLDIFVKESRDTAAKEQVIRKIKEVASQSHLKRVFVLVCASCASVHNRRILQPKQIRKSALCNRRDEVCLAVRRLRERIHFNEEVEFKLFLIESRGDNYFLHVLHGQVPKPRRNKVKSTCA